MTRCRSSEEESRLNTMKPFVLNTKPRGKDRNQLEGEEGVWWRVGYIKHAIRRDEKKE